MKEILGSGFRLIQHVRFVDCVRRDKRNKRFTIAICWSHDDPAFRDQLFAAGPEIAQATGWYPLPQGSRLGSVRDVPAASTSGWSCELSGTPAAVEAAVPPEGGCAVRLWLTSGESLLLDTGLPDKLTPHATDAAALISHVHLDHVGGLVSGRLAPELPVLMSAATKALLLEKGYALAKVPISTVNPGDEVPIGLEATAQAFAVPHLPGAIGYVVRGGGHSVIFTGDICLATSRHDFTASLCDLIAGEPGKRYLLLDATMAGRPFGAGDNDLAADVLRKAADDLVVLADSPEHLLYAYLDLFHTVQNGPDRHSTSFLLPGALQPMFRLLHSAFIRRSVNQLDPFLLGQYGSTMSSWGESRWLFWLDHLRAKPQGRRIWFLSPRESGPEHDACAVDFVAVGRGDLGLLGRSRGWSELSDCDPSAWTLHSSADTLASAIPQLQQAGATVVLFHNFGKRLRSWARDQKLDVDVLPSRSRLSL
ncbi:MAG TPA: MBL fold metallo-hydrolase [Acidimicrobiia bacterium]|nr:MBL fold metallo-hydrolase [Acidimicrobiia bacterium]